MSLFATKPLSRIMQEAEGEHALKRSLNASALVALGVGAIIGAGIFTLTGVAAANNAGPAVVMSFVLAAIGCALAGFCYSEFSTMIPIAGSAYTYAYATMGELLAWIIGWDLVLEYAVGAATVSVGWSATLQSILNDFGISLPPTLFASPFETVKLADGSVVSGVMNLPAVIVVVALSLILMIGISESAKFNSVIVFLKVAVIIVFIAVGYRYINSDNYTPFLPENTGEFGHFGYSGVLRAAGQVFFAYIGFDAVSTAAQEARNPKRDMPIGIIGSLAVCTILYILYALVLTGVVNYKDLGVAAPLAVAVDRLPYPWLGKAMKLASLAGLTSVILVMLLGQSRVFYSMSRDGLLPKLFSAVHPSFRTPWLSNLLMAVFVSFFAAFLPIADLGAMTSIGTLFAFILVCGGIIIMRRTHPELPRPFKTPMVPLIPILGILANLGLMLGLHWHNWARLFVWLAIGMLIYFGYSRSHSKLTRAA